MGWTLPIPVGRVLEYPSSSAPGRSSALPLGCESQRRSESAENIFKGSSVYTSAYNGWFASDGHRFIMFARGPNLIGLGPVGNHWTLMTGRR